MLIRSRKRDYSPVLFSLLVFRERKLILHIFTYFDYSRLRAKLLKKVRVMTELNVRLRKSLTNPKLMPKAYIMALWGVVLVFSHLNELGGFICHNKGLDDL